MEPATAPAYERAQTVPASEPAASLYKGMSLDELMNVEVTSVSRRSEKWMDAASAIEVVTGEDINRSGATNLPEALRLASNLRVAQVNSYGWVISSRGFSGIFTNKLLAMIDGRSVYSPLFGGVWWDIQNVLLEDVDQIEVISGPGGTLWGSNAVNGVINVITKSSKDTQGFYAMAAGGTYLQDWGAVRYGGQIGSDLYYRIYGQQSNRNNTSLPDGEDSSDAWGMSNGGFRLDYYPTDSDTFMMEGDFYDGTERTSPSNSTLNGQYVLGRWSHTISDDSDLSLQLYFERDWRKDIPSTFTTDTETYDIDFQHRFAVGGRNSVLWGLGYRLQPSDVEGSTTFLAFVPAHRDMELFSGFVQDEFSLIPDRVKITVGTKLEHNDFSGFELQPSARIAWTPSEQQTVWGAISRAVRSPSRIDVDYFLPPFKLPPTVPHVAGGPNFISEKVIAYELGYRIEPIKPLFLSLATFYNRYYDLYSVEPIPGTMIYQIQNGTEGDSWGAELSGTYQATDYLRFRGGYTYFHKDLWSKPGHSFDSSSLGNDPKNQVVIQSMLDLPHHVQLDLTGRYVDELPDPRVPGYITFDARVAWQFKQFEFAVVGQNLADTHHSEFGTTEIPRSVYGKVTFRW